MSRRVLALGYGVLAYLGFLAVFAYAVGFLAGVGVPKGVDDGAAGPVWLAVLVDAALLGLFAAQHSVMVRPWFKRWSTRFVPPAIERSPFVLVASLVVALLVWQWRPLPGTVWSVESSGAHILLWTLHGAGWVFLLASTFLIGHFDLFGLRQALARAREAAHTEPGLRQPLSYRVVRYPIMLGFLIAFWVTPEMSGEEYERYAARVPRFIPRSDALALDRRAVAPGRAH